MRKVCSPSTWRTACTSSSTRSRSTSLRPTQLIRTASSGGQAPRGFGTGLGRLLRPRDQIRDGGPHHARITPLRHVPRKGQYSGRLPGWRAWCVRPVSRPPTSTAQREEQACRRQIMARAHPGRPDTGTEPTCPPTRRGDCLQNGSPGDRGQTPPSPQTTHTPRAGGCCTSPAPEYCWVLVGPPRARASLGSGRHRRPSLPVMPTCAGICCSKPATSALPFTCHALGEDQDMHQALVVQLPG